MLHPAGKLLLRNSIRNADAFNRSNEEHLMWQQRNDVEDLDRQREVRGRSSTQSGRSSDRTTFKFSREPRSRSDRYHRPEGISGSSTVEDMDDILSPSCSSNFWLRKLAECKEADPDKWHHDGFKQLYPEDLEPRLNPPSSHSLRHGCFSGHSVELSQKRNKRRRHSSESPQRALLSSDRRSEKRKKKGKKKKKSKKERHAKL